ncbi:hypothetical protein AVEN_275681-1 [Araneus ventricosus]|uniref:Uncharacterized protein n=1 Tax=Araneus ventricosus TaxID=182803 RepID=A0A4Y2EG51_ARAVE|nr:hypothetical protein AVEN_25387-1 [Araneus ventricosus]GBO25746.1 hypothetical protein AVEN_275681-1 [Araneus ventricosus]
MTFVLKRWCSHTQRTFGRMFVWHCFGEGDVGDELANNCAKIASTSGKEIDIPASYSDIQFKIKRYIRDEWEKFWFNEDSESEKHIRGHLCFTVYPLNGYFILALKFRSISTTLK